MCASMIRISLFTEDVPIAIAPSSLAHFPLTDKLVLDEKKSMITSAVSAFVSR